MVDNLQLFCCHGLFLVDVVDEVMAHFKRHGIDFAAEFVAVIERILSDVSEKVKFVLVSRQQSVATSCGGCRR